MDYGIYFEIETKCPQSSKNVTIFALTFHILRYFCTLLSRPSKHKTNSTNKRSLNMVSKNCQKVMSVMYQTKSKQISAEGW